MAAFIEAATPCTVAARAGGWWRRTGSSTTGDAHGTGLAAALALLARAGRFLLIAIVLTLGAGRAAASHIEPTLSWTAREPGAVYWLDTTGKASRTDAQAAFASGAGQVAHQEQVMPLGPDRAIWYRLQLPVVNEPTRAVFRVLFPGTDHVDLFRPAGPGDWH
ncbi:MAG TPA: 7TM-DISM domain-containing protein, partial [Ramlibacter sp.]|nr:7TM-DISM domain-containing protein [Ramlibacter sp.]